MKKIFVFAFALYCLLLNVQTASATIYYVKNGGSDGAVGTSDGTAWATITKVNDELPGMSDGDQVLFKRGSTWANDETIGLNVNFGANKTITFADYDNGEKPIIRTDTQGAIYCTDTDNISYVFKNFHLTGSGGAPGDYTIGFVDAYNVTIDGIDHDAWENDANKASFKTAVLVSRWDGHLEIKNTTIKNIYDPAVGVYKSSAAGDKHSVYLSYSVAGGSTVSTMSIHDNIFDGAYGDNIQAKGINRVVGTPHTIYNNIFTHYGENALDWKNCGGLDIYKNFFDPVGSHEGEPNTREVDIITHTNVSNYGDRCNHVEVHDNTFKKGGNMAVYFSQGDDMDCHHNKMMNRGQAFKVVDAKRITFHNNEFTNLDQNATDDPDVIRLYPNTVQDVEIVNNSFYIGANTNLTRGLSIETATGYTGILVRNNAWKSLDPGMTLLYVSGTVSTPTIDHNTYDGVGDYVSYRGTTYNVEATWIAQGHAAEDFDNPDFSDPTNNNLYPDDASPIIGTGVNEDAAYDDITISQTSVRLPSEGPSGIVVNTVNQTTDAWDRGAIKGLYSGGGSDTTPPLISNFSPDYTVSGTESSVSVSVVTNEASTCQHNETGGIAYDGIGQVGFTTTGGTTHSYTKPLTPDTQTDIFIRCRDAASNANTADFVGTVNVGPADNLLSAEKILYDYSSDDITAGYELYKATDNDYVTSTGSVGGAGIDTVIITYDLGTSHALTATKIYGDDTNNWYCYTWKMETSDDLMSWNTEFTGQDCFGQDWFPKVISTTGRYVKYTITGNTVYHAVQFIELWLEGTPATGGEPPAGSGQGSGIGTGSSKLIYGGPDSMKIR